MRSNEQPSSDQPSTSDNNISMVKPSDNIPLRRSPRRQIKKSISSPSSIFFSPTGEIRDFPRTAKSYFREITHITQVCDQIIYQYYHNSAM